MNEKSPAATPGFSLLRFDAMEVSVRRDDAALTDLSGEWLTLWRKDPAASLFQTPQYARAAWETELGADHASLKMGGSNTRVPLAEMLDMRSVRR